ncbi:hypothetical protein F4815DRAFT_480482 [Daldinia loculata]|nr:hypothetical protein F4815DRAFT_480482 [Daldinia loculata]
MSSTAILSHSDTTNPGRGPFIMGLTWTLTSLCIIVVSIRLYVNKRVQHSIAADDWIMLVATVIQIACQGCITMAFAWGLGKHDADLSFDPDLVHVLKWIWISTTPGIIVAVLARISISILLIRIFGGPGGKRWLRWYLLGFTAFQTVVLTVVEIIIWVQVRPAEALWNPLLKAERWDPRIEQYAVYFGQSLFTFSDLTYVLFPVIIIWNLNMSPSRKIALAALMAMSLLTMTASIMKTVTSASAPDNGVDEQYEQSLGVFWANVEQCFVVIMGCAPSLPAFIKFYFPFVRRASRSLASLPGRSHSRSGNIKPSLPNSHVGDDGIYYNLEIDPSRLGLVSEFIPVDSCHTQSEYQDR